MHNKFGLVQPTLTGADFTAAEVAASFSRSLRHLQRSSCTTLRIHHPPLLQSPGSLAEGTAPEVGAIAAIAALKAQGLIKHVSMGMNTTEAQDGVQPSVDMIESVPAGTFISALLAYGRPACTPACNSATACCVC